jgi:hypothetical protein
MRSAGVTTDARMFKTFTYNNVYIPPLLLRISNNNIVSFVAFSKVFWIAQLRNDDDARKQQSDHYTTERERTIQ